LASELTFFLASQEAVSVPLQVLVDTLTFEPILRDAPRQNSTDFPQQSCLTVASLLDWLEKCWVFDIKMLQEEDNQKIGGFFTY